MLLHVDWRSKGMDAWKEAVRAAGQKKDALVFGCWYKEELEGTELKEMDLCFSVFERCSLKRISFDGCNLEFLSTPLSLVLRYQEQIMEKYILAKKTLIQRSKVNKQP